MFERRHHPLLSRRLFLRRFVKCAAAGMGIVAFSLLLGMVGYHFIEHLSWIDAFANAAMILSGMGPLNPMRTDAGKLFAGFYALYSGLVIVMVAGITFAPVVHRFLHRFHLEDKSEA